MEIAALSNNYFAATCLAFLCYAVPHTDVVVVELPNYPDVPGDFAVPVLREYYNGTTFVYLPPSRPL